VTYTVAAAKGEVVLDGIHRLLAEQVNDLTVRSIDTACKCGSCDVEINGCRPTVFFGGSDTDELAGPTEVITAADGRNDEVGLLEGLFVTVARCCPDSAESRSWKEPHC
jgi:hypothetical protein